jgi:hypothetical protein
MPAYLSPEWVQLFNAALADLNLTDAIAAAGAGSLTVAQGTFRVAQVVTDTASPDNTVRTVLTVDQGRMSLVVDPTGSTAADVTIVLRYEDAVAIARGELHPADALAAGRVRVRGELSVLVGAQSILNAAAAALGRSLTDLTDATDATDATDNRSHAADPDG